MSAPEGRSGDTFPDRPSVVGAVDCRTLIPAEQVARHYARYVTTRCYWHHDTNPSLQVYANGYWCPACQAAGGAVALYRAIYATDGPTAVAALATGAASGVYRPRADAATDRTIRKPPQDLGRRLYRQLTDEAVAYYLFERGLLPETVAAYQLGWGALYDGGPLGYTVPVYRDGELRQIKQRLPGLEKNKYRSLTGCGSWLFLGEDLAWRDRVILAGGEFDAIAARQHGYVAAAPTSGEARFSREWLRDLAGTTPYCAFDMDERGEEGYRRLYRTLRGNLKRLRFPAKDLTLFFLHHNPAELQGLLDEADERFCMGGG